MIHEASPPIRYSPWPLERYEISSGFGGPANDRRVSSVEIWNLAYLSHDFDKELMHKDPHFLTHVRRTCQYDYMAVRVDLTSTSETTIAKHLRMPAPWFLKWLLDHKQVLVKLPMYEAYGSAWVLTMEQRAKKCDTHDHGPDEPVHDLGAAVIELSRFMRR